MLRVFGRAVCREQLFRRGHRHRRAQGQRPVAAGAELGAVPGLGIGPLHRSVAAVFFREPVLTFVIARSESDEAMHTLLCCPVDCFASLAMTAIFIYRPTR